MTNATHTSEHIAKQPRDDKGRLLPKGTIIDSPMKPILDALNMTLRSIRAAHPEVPNVVLVVGTSSSKAHGHFHARTWDGGQHEVMLSGQSLQRGAKATLATLLHECAHAMGHARGIKSTSRQGRFHNEAFKALAEELGIDVMKDSQHGWTITLLPASAAKQYRIELAAIAKALKTYRLPDAPKAARPKTTIKLTTQSGRSVTVPISFHEAGPIFDGNTGELFTTENGDTK